jgi:hypothetical protein
MPDPKNVYGPGLNEVGLPSGEEGGEGFEGDAFSLGDIGKAFGTVKSWLVKNDDKVIQVVVPWLKKIVGQTVGLEALELPRNTPITQMVLPSQVARMSPAVKKLTKQDLLALGGWGVPRKLPSDLGLTPKDIQTIRDIFTPRLTQPVGFNEEDPEAWSISCCSCTPCCCAAAVMQPVRNVA